ncbi:esterase/lipase family protein [Desulfocastanea catecholica]
MKSGSAGYPDRKKAYRGYGAPGLACIGLLLLVVLSGCAKPVGVQRISPQTSYQLNITNPMGSEELSNGCRTVLHRYNLQGTSVADLQKNIEYLRDLISKDDRRDIFFALAELSYLQGTKLRKSDAEDLRLRAPNVFLQSAVYAYLYLLGDNPEPLPSAYDIRFRQTCDLYNRALWQAFPENPDHSLNISGGLRTLPGGGRLQLSLKIKTMGWDITNISGIFPADAYKIHGFAVRNRTPGLGLPLVVRTKKTKESPNGGALPITGFLRIPAGIDGVSAETTTAELELYSAFDTTDVEVNGRQVPLETDTTTPLAHALHYADAWNVGVKRFLSGEQVSNNILFIQPYKPGRIPVVFVHGTASSPVWWAEMFNTLRADPHINKKFQFWFYQYNTSNMMAFSAAQMRATLIDKIHQLDPQLQDPALQDMVVIGHSQGRILTKMSAVHSGDVLWNAVSDKSLEQMDLDPEDENSIRSMLFFEPLPFVKRVVFISTPHRGSYLTKAWVRELIRKIIDIPVSILTVDMDELQRITSQMKVAGLLQNKIPTSIDGMSSDNPLLEALADLPLAPGVKGHSIIAVKPGMDIESGNDGVVEYTSAHLPGMESEFIVRDEHSCQGNPFTIEEVRRILLKHIGSDIDKPLPLEKLAQ